MMSPQVLRYLFECHQEKNKKTKKQKNDHFMLNVFEATQARDPCFHSGSHGHGHGQCHGHGHGHAFGARSRLWCEIMSLARNHVFGAKSCLWREIAMWGNACKDSAVVWVCVYMYVCVCMWV
jgi:hypothetical protein